MIRVAFDGRFGAAVMLSLVAATLAIALVVVEYGGALPVRAETEAEAAAQVASPGVLGDVDCSESVQMRDVLEMRRWVAGLGTPADCLAYAGDANCDGELDSGDALQLMRFLAGLPGESSPGCDAIGEPIGPPISSYELIDAALKDGDIDLGTALLYKAYAAFGDSRLPAIYQGNDSLVEDNPFLHAVQDHWADLSQEEKDLLMPYLVPPNMAGSWYDWQRAGSGFRAFAEDWATVTSATLPVKAWYHTSSPGDAARAAAVIASLEQTIWAKLTGLMGRTPIPDCGAACPYGGGDNRLDIYIVNSTGDSYVQWMPPGSPECSLVPTFMVLRDTSPATLAHEFMHVLQFAFDGPFDCMEYRWISEASAEWASAYVYPGSNHEHYRALLFLLYTERRMDIVDRTREYAAYLFPFFLANSISPDVIREIWELGETRISSLAAVNQATAAEGGLEEITPKFGLYNWNRAPVDHYKTWDGLEFGARAQEETLTDGQTLLAKDVEYLGSTHYSWEFTDEAGYIVFTNSLAGRPHAHVQAIVSIDGSWQEPEDWSDEPQKSFCRNLPGQDIDRLVLIVSNSDWQGKTVLEMGSVPPKVQADQAKCGAYVGSASTTFATEYTVGRAWISDVRFEYDDEYESPPSADYYTASGTVNWTYHGTNGHCTVAGSGSFSVATGEGHIFIGGPNGNGDRQYYASGGRPAGDPVENYKATMTCPDHEPFLVNPDFNWIWLIASIMSGHLVEEDGRLRGTDSQDYGGDIQTWEWDLQPAP